jgi:hypothetical protein
VKPERFRIFLNGNFHTTASTVKQVEEFLNSRLYVGVPTVYETLEIPLETKIRLKDKR